MSTTTSRTFARALTLVGAVALTATLFSISTPVADATTGTTASTFGGRVVATASTRYGSPYARGAAGPSRFDCSGLTLWTFAKHGHRLAHSAAAQYRQVKHIRAHYRRMGDLVFFHGSNGIYHVGIYAGNNQIWHSPYSGAKVRKERIWTSSVYYGRVG